jgi:hypothetical protein
MHYYRSQERQQFEMRYNIEGLETLPLLITPKESTRELYQSHFRDYRPLIFPYTSRYLDNRKLTTQASFAYRFTFALLSYLSLRLLLKHTPINRQLFVPLLRLHVKKQRDWPEQEKFVRQFSKILAHLLNEEEQVLSNTQGFDVQAVINKGNTQATARHPHGGSDWHRTLRCPPRASRTAFHLQRQLSRRRDAPRTDALA